MDKSKNTKSLSKAIDEIVRESLKSSLYQNAVEEKDNQKKIMGEEDDDIFADEGGDDKKDASSDSDSEEKTSSKTQDSEKEKLKKGKIKPKDIVDKLNTIRSGKSFKDSAISSKLDEYVESLSKAEKVALLAFLKGLAQIVTGEIEPDAATDPADPEPDVKMQKGAGGKKVKTIKPNVIKAPEKEKVEKKPSSEDTSGPVPISPKKK
jgi:hypothetical protein